MGPFFLILLMIVYQSALIPRKPPCPKKSWLRACQMQYFASFQAFYLTY